LPIGFFTLLTALFFGDIRGSVFVERDLLAFFIPPRQFWVEEVKNLTFPLWNPYYYNGHPLFATLQAGVLYPFSALYLFLPFDWAFNLNIEIHFALCGWFTYLLLRGMKASQGAALVAGIAFMLSGYLISVFNLLSTLLSVTWVPLFFLTFFAAIKKDHLGYAIASGFVGTCMFLGGGVEACYFTFGITFILVIVPELLFEEPNLPDLKRRVILFSSFCLVFFGLSAIQLIPFLELSSLSIRSEGLPYKEAGTWSLHPFDLIEFFVPDQYGVQTDLKKYWAFQSWLKTIYMGGIPFILALFFIKNWDRRVQGLLFLFFISLGLAMGKNALFHHFLYDYLPFFNKLRYPVKFIFLAILVLCIAAGLGYDQLKKMFAEKNKESKKWAKNSLILGFLLMIVFGAINFFHEYFVEYFKGVGWGEPQYNPIEMNMFNIKRFLGFASLFSFGVYLYSKPRFNNSYFPIVLIMLLILDLFYAHSNFYQKMDYDFVQKPGKFTQYIMSDPGLFRVYVTPKTRKAKLDLDDSLKKLIFLKEKLEVGMLGDQRILSTNGIVVTKQKSWEKWASLIDTSSLEKYTNILNMLNVKYVLSIKYIDSPNYKLVTFFDPFIRDPENKTIPGEFETIKLYENKKVLPHAFLVPNCKVVSSDKEYKEIFHNKLFNSKEITLLEKEPKEFACGDKRQINKKETLNIDSYESNLVKISANVENQRLLFLSDSYYPGWKAYVDGEEVEILRANYLFRAIVLEAGNHQIRFKYDPLSFKLGIGITLFTLLACLFYFIRIRFTQNRKLTDGHLA
jgi:hypothetical protein